MRNRSRRPSMGVLAALVVTGLVGTGIALALTPPVNLGTTFQAGAAVDGSSFTMLFGDIYSTLTEFNSNLTDVDGRVERFEEVISISDAGYIGVGTENPNQKLHIRGVLGENPAILLTANDGGANVRLRMVDSAQAGLQIETGSGKELMSILNVGNVGIGTSSPSERLDLGGGNIDMGYEQVRRDCVGSSEYECMVECTSGKQVLGGGCTIDNSNEYIWRSDPQGTSGWRCRTKNTLGTASGLLRATAICANIR